MDAIAVLYAKELRSALRERSLVIFSVLLPLLLYPLMLWIGLSITLLAQGQADRRALEVATAGPDPTELRARLDGQDGLELRPLTAPSPRQAIEERDADLVLELNDDGVIMTFDGRLSASDDARARVSEVLDEHRRVTRAALAKRAGLDDDAWAVFDTTSKNVASEAQVGSFVLANVAPMTMVLMLVLAAAYPAIDATAGERERSTWETTLILPVPLWRVMVAKYLYVITLSSTGAVLNLLGLSVSLYLMLRSVTDTQALGVAFPWQALPALLLGVVLLAALVSAVMMLAAGFARTFREGQSLTSPLVLVVLAAVFVMLLPDDALTLHFAAIPIVNVALLLAQAMLGTLEIAFVGLTVAVSLAFTAVCLAVATWLVRDEGFVTEARRRRRWRRRRHG